MDISDARIQQAYAAIVRGDTINWFVGTTIDEASSDQCYYQVNLVLCKRMWPPRPHSTRPEP